MILFQKALHILEQTQILTNIKNTNVERPADRYENKIPFSFHLIQQLHCVFHHYSSLAILRFESKQLCTNEIQTN